MQWLRDLIQWVQYLRGVKCPYCHKLMFKRTIHTDSGSVLYWQCPNCFHMERDRE